MIVFGSGCLNVCNEVREFAFSRINEVTSTTVPAGTSTGVAKRVNRISTDWRSALFRSPLELGAVGPDTVQDHGDFSGDGDLGFFGADTLHQPNAPGLQS